MRTGRPANLPSDLWKKVQIGAHEECWPWQGATRGRGYGDFKVANRHVVAHRLAYELAHGVDPGDFLVCHSCDNPACCNPAHLFLGTDRDNALDRQSKGRSARPNGSSNPNAKLTEASVREIRSRYAAGERQADLAREFGVNRSRIHAIVRYPGRVWVAS